MQYIWQHQLLDTSHLVTTDGRRVQVIDAGRLNTDAGPDFFNAKIRIDGCMWVGNIEIHYRASDWKRHNHHSDKAYDSVILHIVELDDMSVARSNGEVIPQLVMRAAPTLRGDFKKLVENAPQLSCGERLPGLNPFLITDWINSLAVERLQAKSERIATWLDLYKGNWEEVCYITLSRNMGFGINSDAFERLALATPLKVLAKHSDSLTAIEAMLFGQSGLIDNAPNDDSYVATLRNEYNFYAQKFGLKPPTTLGWKMARMRPQNFPHRRIAVLATMIECCGSVVSTIFSSEHSVMTGVSSIVVLSINVAGSCSLTTVVSPIVAMATVAVSATGAISHSSAKGCNALALFSVTTGAVAFADGVKAINDACMLFS